METTSEILNDVRQSAKAKMLRLVADDMDVEEAKKITIEAWVKICQCLDQAYQEDSTIGDGMLRGDNPVIDAAYEGCDDAEIILTWK